MSARTVSVRLTADVSNYLQGTRNAAKATRDLGSEVAKEAEKNKAAWETAGRGMLLFGAAGAAGLGMAVSKAANFDASMAKVRAATHESVAGMEALRDAALEAGARTAFSASEAAQGIEALAKAGVSTADILNGGLNGSLDLAAAGSLEVGEAAEITASALTQFGLKGKDVAHVADLLAAGAGKAQGDVTDMGAALKQSGLVAAQTGLSIEEATGGLAAFAAAGLTGSDAGTSFKTALMRLNPTSEEAAALMNELGLRAYDSSGQFVGLSEYAGQLQAALGGMTAEQRNSTLATIFGSDAIRAAAILYENGAAGVEKWETAVNDAGYAQETAAIQLDTLKGDLEAFGGSLETAFIGSASSANGVLREVVQTATGAVNAFSALPGPVQTGAFAIGAVATAASLAGGAFLVAVPKVVAFRAALGEMGPTTQRVAGGLGRITGVLGGPWGLALTAATVGLGVWGASQAASKARVDEHTEALDAQTGALTEVNAELVAKRLDERGLLDEADRLGISIKTVTAAALGQAGALGELRGMADRYAQGATDAARAGLAKGNALDRDTAAAQGNADAVMSLIGVVESEGEAIGKAREQWERTSEATQAATSALAEVTAGSGTAAAGMAGLGTAAGGAVGEVVELTDAQKGLESALGTFINPLGVYQDLLSQKEEAERRTAEATAAATEAADDSWEDYVREVSVSLDEVAARLEADNQAHVDWEMNLVTVAQRAGADVAMTLADMGEDGIRLTAAMATGTEAEVRRMAEALRTNAAIGGDAAVRELDDKMKVMAAIASSGGKATAEALATQLGIGADRVSAIAAQYGINLTAGLAVVPTAKTPPPTSIRQLVAA